MKNVPEMTAEDLAEHLRLLDVATREELDQLLLDLLQRAWPAKVAQDC
jgi:hypothetical protein